MLTGLAIHVEHCVTFHSDTLKCNTVQQRDLPISNKHGRFQSKQRCDKWTS